LIGRFAAAALPVDAINLAAGAAYLGFAVWTLRGDELGDDDQARATRVGRWAILAIGTSFFLAELGDKTMLATITLGATHEPIGTWLGSTVGMVLADALAVAVLVALRLVVAVDDGEVGPPNWPRRLHRRAGRDHGGQGWRDHRQCCHLGGK
jgi:putative Ca2+/H+ antiporter (TMEM165/GDT1 family)